MQPFAERIHWAFFTVNDPTSQRWFESNVYENWNHSNLLFKIQRKIWNEIMPRLKLTFQKIIHPDTDRIIRSMQARSWWKETIWVMIQPFQTVLSFLLYPTRTFNSIHSRRNRKIKWGHVVMQWNWSSPFIFQKRRKDEIDIYIPSNNP